MDVSLIAALCILAAPPSGQDGPWDDDRGKDKKPQYTPLAPNKMPVRRVERPLTVTAGTYELIFDLAFGRVRPSTSLIGFEGGAGYGITEDFEVGIILIPVTFSTEPGSGFSVPSLFVEQRLLRGVFELSLTARSQLPLEFPMSVSAEIPMRLHLGPHVSIDTGVAFGATVGAGEFFPSLGVPVSATVQIMRQLSLRVGAEAGIVDFERNRAAVNFSARAGWTIESKRGAWADLGLLFRSKNYSIRGGDVPDPSLGNYFTVAIVTQFFIPEESPYENTFDF